MSTNQFSETAIRGYSEAANYYKASGAFSASLAAAPSTRHEKHLTQSDFKTMSFFLNIVCSAVNDKTAAKNNNGFTELAMKSIDECIDNFACDQRFDARTELAKFPRVHDRVLAAERETVKFHTEYTTSNLLLKAVSWITKKMFESRVEKLTADKPIVEALCASENFLAYAEEKIANIRAKPPQADINAGEHNKGVEVNRAI